MVVVCTESGITLWAFSVSRLVACLQTVQTEHVEALGKNRILFVCLASGTSQLLLYA